MICAPELANNPYDPSRDAVIKADVVAAVPDTREDEENDAELDATLVKHAVTMLHQEEERQFRTYDEYADARIADIVEDHEHFLRNQRNICSQSLKTNRRKSLFTMMTGAYFAQSLSRARHLQRQKTREFHVKTVEKQNEEFLNRALLPENATDDQAQTAYRNMILFNLENLYADASEAERRKALDEAAEVIYRKIIEKRLEVAPDAVKPLLLAPAVRRVLGDAAIREYQKRASAIERDDALRREATELVDREASPQEAKNHAKRKRPEDKEAFLRHYHTLRYIHHRKRCLTHILNLDAVWREVASHDFNHDAIPVWVKNTEPKLYAAVLSLLEVREKNGGVPTDPKYQVLLNFADGYDPHTVCEKLADEDALYRFVSDLGGPNEPMFQLCLRMLLGRGTEKDKALLRDLDRARNEYVARVPVEAATDEEMQLFLCRFYRCRIIRLGRSGYEDLDEAEVREIIDKLIKCVNFGNPLITETC